MLNMLFIILSAFLGGVLVTYVRMNHLKKKAIASVEAYFEQLGDDDFHRTFDRAYTEGIAEGRKMERMERINEMRKNQQ